ncbi:MAG: phosphoribosyltransferase [bacterium]
MLQFYRMDSAKIPSRRYINEQELMLDGFRLGKKIYDSGFRPDYIVGIWRGGSAVGIVVQECLQYFGVDTDHIPIRTSYEGMQSYPEMIKNANQIRVHGLEYLVNRLEANHRLLLVDDVYSSGFSIQAVIQKLKRKLRQNMPDTIRVAAVWHRPVEGRPSPDYCVNQTNEWLVLPYELSGLSLDEIKKHKPWAGSILKTLKSDLVRVK